MTSRTAVLEEAGPIRSPSRGPSESRPEPLSLLALSAWCGLVAGLLEVGVTVLRRRWLDIDPFSQLSRHFIWLTPSIDLAIFLVLGLALSALVVCWPRRGGRLATRLLGALTLLPPIWAAFPRIYGPAGLLLALGLAARIVPALEDHARGFRRLVRVSFPAVAGLVPILAAGLWGSGRIEAWREERRPLPPPGSPNVLLIVLDTVAAGHLGLYGYDRPTSPTLDELASRGIRFDGTRGTASWTLPSHASLFTGRWPHELSAGWLTPLDGTYPTLAEFLGSRGYATAGFIANLVYCGPDTGLARGFTTYRDHGFPRLTASRTAVLVDRTLEGTWKLERFLDDRLAFDLLGPAADRLWRLVKVDRKEAAVINSEFLDWLSRRRRPERPFFAFLNFYDAHYAYELRERGIHRFGDKPRNRAEATWLRDWPELTERGPSPAQIRFVRDAYDDCVADLDEQLGRLIDELERRGVLGRTWVIITADHGESFGEHPGVFEHGRSLYRTEVHVPLIIIPPAGGPPPRVVAEAVSLRDLPATIVDVLGLRAGSPFPGRSLARHWSGSSSAPSAGALPPEPVLSEVVPIQQFGTDPSRWLDKPRWPLAALTDGDWTYIRREGDVREQLFHVRDDPQEAHDLARDPSMRPTLLRMRDELGRLTAGPLTPERFHP
jgi:arylsulfatase A-like enzyme